MILTLLTELYSTYKKKTYLQCEILTLVTILYSTYNTKLAKEILAFCNLERAQLSSIMIAVLTFQVKKSTMNNSIVKSNLLIVVVFVLESKGL